MTATDSHSSVFTPAAAPARPAFSLISHERLWELYAAMLRCRALAERAGQLVLSGFPAQMLHAGLGREATYSGVLVGLHSADLLATSPDDTLGTLLKGVSLKALFANCAPPPSARRKKASVPAKPRYPAGILPPSPSPTAQLHIANGVALANKSVAGGPITVALCGPGSAPTGDWQQALTFAGANDLPVLFICHSEARDGQSIAAAEARFDQLAVLAQVARVPAIAVDAHDVVAVYRVASESISRARLRRGPTLIECRTQPLISQSAGTDQPLPADPVSGMEIYLKRKGLFDPARKEQLLAAFRTELDAATRKHPSGPHNLTK